MTKRATHGASAHTPASPVAMVEELSVEHLVSVRGT